MEEERVYVRDYVAKPGTRIYNPASNSQKEEPRRCDGSWLTIDHCGYKIKRCKKRLKPGKKYYYKSHCKCSANDKLYCSERCCYPYQCNNCKRRSCKQCYIANANDCCAYCVYLSDDCDCLAYVDGSWTKHHDKAWCDLPIKRTSVTEDDDDQSIEYQ